MCHLGKSDEGGNQPGAYLRRQGLQAVYECANQTQRTGLARRLPVSQKVLSAVSVAVAGHYAASGLWVQKIGALSIAAHVTSGPGMRPAPAATALGG